MGGPDPAATWKRLLRSLQGGESLGRADTAWAMGQVMSGATESELTQAAVGAFFFGLHAKGETAEEIDGFVDVMLDHARLIEVDGPAVDVVGTGGDGANTVNISTMAAIVVAGAGATVVKHGNRAASSLSGAADVLEALGLDLELAPDVVAEVARTAGITFCFARVFHPAMRFAGPIRTALGVPTAFNFLGPLTNPARPVAQAVGCGDARMVGVMAEVFAQRGVSALVFRGDDGLDELTTTTTSQVHVVSGGQVRREVLDPSRLGIAPAGVEDLRGGDAAHNAQVARDLLAGRTGAVRDAVVLNAAGALVALDGADAATDGAQADGSSEGGSFEDAMASALVRAADAIDSGAAAAALERWVAVSRELAGAR